MNRTIIVRKAVLAAVRKLEQLASAREGTSPLDLAEIRMNDCRQARDRLGMRFWRSVWVHLMQINYAREDIQIIEGANDETGAHEEMRLVMNAGAADCLANVQPSQDN